MESYMRFGRIDMRFAILLILLSPIAQPLSAQQKEYDVAGAVELHVYLTAIHGKEDELERFFREDFYPAIRHQPGFISSELLRKPNSNEYVLRHTFRSEELRMKWSSSPERQKVWPALIALTTKATWAGFGVIYPPRK